MHDKLKRVHSPLGTTIINRVILNSIPTLADFKLDIFTQKSDYNWGVYQVILHYIHPDLMQYWT